MKKLFLLLPIMFSQACSTLKEPSHQDLIADDYTEVKRFMRQFIKREMKNNNITGLSISLIDDQNVVWSDGFGFADKENKIKASSNTIYRAGSVSKTFNAMAIMQLAEQKKLDINQPLVTYLPAFSIKSRFGSTDNITLKNIMTHHSGIPSDIVNGLFSKNPKKYTTVVEDIKAHYTAYPADKIFSYSNVAITLSGHAVETVSGSLYENYIQESLLSPLQMQQSSFTGILPTDNAAKGYIKGKFTQEWPIRDIPAGGLNSSVVDLSHFLKMIHADGSYNQHQIIKSETLHAMMSAQNQDIALDLNLDIGFGFFSFDDYLYDKYKVVGHSGATIAHSALIATAPDLKIGIALLANSPANNDALNTIAKKIMRLSTTIKTGLNLEQLQNKNSVANIEKDTDLSGLYATDHGLVKIEGKPGHYKLKVGSDNFILKQRKDNTYMIQYKLFNFIPIKIGGLSEIKVFAKKVLQHPLLVGDINGNQFILGEQITPQKRVPAWDMRLGEYLTTTPLKWSSENIEHIRFTYKNNVYIAEVTTSNGNTISYPIAPINNDEAIILGLGRGMRETLYASSSNNEEQLNYSGMAFKRR